MRGGAARFEAIGFWLVLAVCGALALGAQEDQSSSELRQRISTLLDRSRFEEALALVSEAIERDPENSDLQFANGFALEGLGRNEDALKSYTRVLELDPRRERAYQQRGSLNFKLGRFGASVADFDKVIELVPARAPHHWQRGISLYYAGRYAEGAEQFWIHRTVNPNDVENAVWRFLCMARDPSAGLEKAREVFLPIARDGRRPMMEIHALYAGRATQEEVFEAARASASSPPEALRYALFYAHLYVGLYLEATGDREAAREHMAKAAGEYAIAHYMGDVARVHLKLLESARDKSNP